MKSGFAVGKFVSAEVMRWFFDGVHKFLLCGFHSDASPRAAKNWSVG